MFSSALSYLDVVNIDILPSFNLTCMYPTYSYINKLYVTCLSPIVVSVVIFVLSLGLALARCDIKEAATLFAYPFLGGYIT